MNDRPLPACPVETTLMLIGSKWKVLILRDLMDGTRRFSELKKSIGAITQKVLTSNLRDMEDCGLLTRTVYPEVPPRVEYTLTEYGKVNLKGLSTWEKCDAIISVAHPDFRDELIAEAEKMHIWRRTNKDN